MEGPTNVSDFNLYHQKRLKHREQIQVLRINDNVNSSFICLKYYTFLLNTLILSNKNILSK